MTKQFSIYKPYGFYWTRTFISYAFIAGVVLLILTLKHLVGVPQSHPIYSYLSFAIVLPGIYHLLLSVLVVNKYRSLKGTLEGHIIFSKDAIEIGDIVYPLSAIRYIVFEGTDWLGDERTDRGFSNFFENTLSQGVDNTLMLHLLDGQVVRTRFQKLFACELRNVEDTILHYYLHNKLTYLQTVDALCMRDKEEQRNLKELKLHQPEAIPLR